MGCVRSIPFLRDGIFGLNFQYLARAPRLSDINVVDFFGTGIANVGSGKLRRLPPQKRHRPKKSH
jgi:hypothetical protein